MHPNYAKEHLLEAHRLRNQSAKEDEIFIRDNIRFRTVQEARYAYEHFCFINPEMTKELDSFLSFSRFRKRLLDVGSLFGVFAFSFCAKINRETLAIDPSPDALQVLRANCHLNPEANVRVYECAAGDKASDIQMKREWKHLVASTNVDKASVTMRSRTCDSITADMRFYPDVVKIDVEGFENHVLRGMNNLIYRFRPDIHIEVHPQYLSSLGTSGLESFSLLRETNYRIYDMDGREVTSYQENGTLQFNWYCTHRFGESGGRLS